LILADSILQNAGFKEGEIDSWQLIERRREVEKKLENQRHTAKDDELLLMLSRLCLLDSIYDTLEVAIRLNKRVKQMI